MKSMNDLLRNLYYIIWDESFRWKFSKNECSSETPTVAIADGKTAAYSICIITITPKDDKISSRFLCKEAFSPDGRQNVFVCLKNNITKKAGMKKTQKFRTIFKSKKPQEISISLVKKEKPKKSAVDKKREHAST